MMGRTSQPLSALVRDMQSAFPSSGEINFTIADPKVSISRVHQHYQHIAHDIDWLDGLSMSFDRWRLNLRMSSTEPLVRLNVETKGDKDLLRAKTKEVSVFLQGETPATRK
jgi:phosphomannomutase